MTFRFRSLWLLSCCPLAVLAASSAAQAANAPTPQNLFANPSFENGRDGWHPGVAGKTAVRYTVDSKEAGAGQHSALLSIGPTVEDWGLQFGQTIEAPAPGKTYTFAVLARSTGEPAALRLEIERSAKPWDRAAVNQPTTVSKDSWRELHVTFKLEKPFREGWFAYVSCKQPNAEFRLDMFRLYEGEYVPYKQAAREEAAAAGVGLFDTGSPSSTPMAGDQFAKRAGWTTVPEDKSDHRFKGDAVALNDRLALVLRQGAAGAEIYSRTAKGFVPRAVLTPVGAEAGAKLASVAIVDNSATEVSLDVEFRTAGGKPLTVRYDLAIGQVFVRTEARQGTTALCVEAPCRYLVLPDFFADDIVIDAADIPIATAEIPSENFLLHLLPERDAMVMTVAGNRGQDARIDLSGEAGQRTIQRSRVEYGPKGEIWVAVIQGPDVWHQRDVKQDEAGKVVSLDWTAPFPALWRVDWKLSNKLTASWEMIAQQASGAFLKHGWFGGPQSLPADRKRWTTVLGSFQYPCWVDRSGRGFLQPLTKPDRFQGPAVIYPINRAPQTPLSEFTVVDVVRATLGVGPCEYVLDVEGQGATMKGRATCATRDTLKPIYAAKQQKKKRAEIERALTEVVIFVKHIRGRIDQYVDFGHELLAYFAEQKKARPELAEFLAEMETLAKGIDATVARRKASIKTPQYVVDLTEEFRQKLLDYEGDDALKQCTRITHAIVDVGGNQDELVGECRNAVKVLRQRAGLALATNPRAVEVAREIRDRTQKVLRNATSYEAPRH
jgi:hypothetical protein